MPPPPATFSFSFSSSLSSRCDRRWAVRRRFRHQDIPPSSHLVYLGSPYSLVTGETRRPHRKHQNEKSEAQYQPIADNVANYFRHTTQHLTRYAAWETQRRRPSLMDPDVNPERQKVPSGATGHLRMSVLGSWAPPNAVASLRRRFLSRIAAVGFCSGSCAAPITRLCK